MSAIGSRPDAGPHLTKLMRSSDVNAQLVVDCAP